MSQHNASLFQLLIFRDCIHCWDLQQADGHSGDQQPPLPTPPVATTALQHLCAAAADTAAENRAAPSHSHALTIFTSASSVLCPSGYICLQTHEKWGGGKLNQGREAGISNKFGVTLGPAVPRKTEALRKIHK